MPEFYTVYRGRKSIVCLDNDAAVIDIYPVEKGDRYLVTEDDKIAFEVENSGLIYDAMDDHAREMAEHRKARGRERVSGE